jgi:hypothetical protein
MVERLFLNRVSILGNDLPVYERIQNAFPVLANPAYPALSLRNAAAMAA